MQSITRSKLIDRLAVRAGNLTPKDVEVSVSLILDAIANALARGDRVEIRGFGSFDLNYRSPRNGRNPKTGKQVQVPAKHVPHFKAGTELRERVDMVKRNGIEFLPGVRPNE
jgi:integration host factor subunit beta